MKVKAMSGLRSMLAIDDIAEVMRQNRLRWFGHVERRDDVDDVVLRHTLPVFTGLGRCPIVNWDFCWSSEHFWTGCPSCRPSMTLPGLEPATSRESQLITTRQIYVE